MDNIFASVRNKVITTMNLLKKYFLPWITYLKLSKMDTNELSRPSLCQILNVFRLVKHHWGNTHFLIFLPVKVAHCHFKLYSFATL